MSLTNYQVEVYSRQIILRELGGRGQEKLLASRVRIIGAGPAAATAATYLAGAGFGVLEAEDALISSGPFSDLETRLADTRVESIQLSKVPDILISASVDLPPRPRANLGAVAICATRRGEMTVIAAPMEADGCLACLAQPTPVAAAEPVEEALAGSLAALIACRWAAAIEVDRTSFRLVLSADSPAWMRESLEPIHPCPAGCSART